ncbi:hypothetical protein [Rhabdothermincola sp.]|uniref:hypothetical protein n=1 Tax=Rhabdothermincola sp. TaxID=2820405 RepID=UPI002FE37210
MGPADAIRSGEVRLTIPANPRFLRLARLAASGVATDAGFDLDHLEDLRLAIDEACAVLLEGAPGGDLELVYRFRADGGVEIEGSCPSDGSDLRLHPVAADLLAVTTTEHHLASDSNRRRFRLVKLPEAPGA